MSYSINERRLSRGAILLLSSLFALGTVACGSDAADEPQNGNVEPEVDAGDDDKDVARVEVTPAAASVVERRTVQLEAKAFNAEDEELADVSIAWASSDEELATVDETGLVTSLRPGEVTITASASGKSASATITVTASTATSLELSADTTDIPLDGEVSLVAVVKDAEGFELLGRTIAWKSDDESVATVSESGAVLGIDLGETKITATLGGFEDSVEVRVVHRFTKLFAGVNHTCGLTAAGRAWCWGANQYGTLGNDDAKNQSVPVRVAMDPKVSFRMLALGESTSCGLTEDDEVWCWGDNDDLVLGRSYDDLSISLVPVRLEDRSFKTISGMGYGVCGLDEGGFAYCWGLSSSDYELGDPDVIQDSAVPVAVSAPAGQTEPVAFAELRTGRYHSCGLTAEGRLFCWGYNGSGQLGDGTYESKAHSVEPLAGKKVKTFALGRELSCAVTTDETTYCWGENSYGQVNDDSVAIEEGYVFSPFVRFEATSFVPTSLSLGEYHGCALDEGGLASCWGGNEDGQLGRETGDAVFAGLGEVFGGHRFTQLVSGYDFTCGLADDGKTYCWGDNGYGKLGTGDTVDTNKPKAVVGQ